MNVINKPSYDESAEQVLLGSLLIDCESERCQHVLRKIKSNDFYIYAHKVIYSVIQTLVSTKRPVDGITVSDKLKETGQDSDTGGFAYIAELAKNTPSAANVRAYSDIVKNYSVERQMIGFLHEAQAIMYDSIATNEKVEKCQSILNSMFNSDGTQSGLKPVSDVVSSWINSVDNRMNGKEIGISTGIESLDEILGVKKILKGSLFVVGARPKMGKTTLYIKLANHCAINEKLPVAAFSLEMQDQQLLEKMITQETGINSDVFYSKNSNDEMLSKAFSIAGKLADNGNLYIDDTPAITLQHITSESRRIKRLRGSVGMILVDYLTLMKGEKAERNDLSYGLITKGLKALAKELNCVVVLLTQLNRDLEKRADKRPFPSDSRDTGQIEQDCDYWLGIYRDAVYNEKADKHLTELILRYNRHGNSGTAFVDMKNGAIFEVNQEEAKDRVFIESISHDRGF